MQEYEKRILQCVLTEKITPIDLKNWLPFHLLKPEFISKIHMVIVHSVDEAIIVMKNKNVYSLGYSDSADLHTAIYPKKIKELCGKNIKTFAHGDFFILALTEEGEVYYWEFGERNLDAGKPHIHIMSPTRVAGLSKKRVMDIACGKGHSLALTSDGKVYAWGENNYGQVGNENTAIFISVPWQVKHELENKNVVHIACGATFNIVITDENKIYGWGNKDNDQISTVQTQKYYVYPREITNIPNKIVKVTCGYHHTLALTNKGEIYAWGNNNKGQIGVNSWRIYGTYNLSDPIMVSVPEMGKVLDIAAFDRLSVAVGYDGTIYVWGQFFYENYSTTPLSMKFSRIHELFVYNDLRITHKPLTVFTNNYKYVEEILDILESVGAAFDDPLTSDFTIQVEGRSIYVHKAILKIRCEYFKKMFQHGWAENIQSTSDSSSVFTVSDEFSYIVYKAFLKYLYTGTIDLPSENALELMELADMYWETNLINDLIKDRSQIIKKAITVSNVSFFYNKAIKYNAKELEKFCFQFALCHMTADTLLEDIKLDMNMQAKFIHKAATQSRDTIMSMSSKKFCSPEDVEKRNSTIKKEDEMQKYKKRILQCFLAERIISMDLKYWPFFRMLKPEFILQIHMVMIFHQEGDNAIIVTKDKNVYGLDYYSMIEGSAIYPKKIKELCGKNIKTFVPFFETHMNSGTSILALTEEGEVYSCDFGDVAEITPEKSMITQVAGLSEKRVVDIACGYCHCLALTSDGKVYAWGENDYGQVDGNENTAIFLSVPRQVKHELENKNVVHIACGSNFNIVITNENKIYGWGDNDSGQISTVRSQKYYAYPREISNIPNKIVKVTCGYHHTLALTNKGEIYAWGLNLGRQIGVNKDYKELQRSGPIMVNVPEMGKVLDIAAFGNLSVAVGYDRIIYIWGNFYNHFSGIKNPFPTKFSTIQEVFAYSGLKITHKPLTMFMNIEEVLNILESVGTAFDNPLTSDFTIQVEGRPIYVHKAILKIRCEYFKKMFQHDWAENIQSTSDSSSVFTVSDEFSHIVYKAFLKYLYTGTIDLPSENALELMELADMYCETNLIKDCSQIIKKAITVSNVLFFYIKAIECNAKELEEFCFQFALRHMTDLVLSEDYINLDVNTKDNFMRRAAKENAFRM